MQLDSASPGPFPLTQRVARLVLPLYLLSIYGTLSWARTVTEAVRSAGYLRVVVGGVFLLAALGAGLAIRRLPAARSWRLWAALGAALGVYAAVILPLESPEEKLHFVQYGLVALLAERAAPSRWSPGVKVLAAGLFTAAAGWVDEGIQGLLPNRYYDLRDVGFNALAGVFALVVLRVVQRLGRPPPYPPR